MINKQYIRTCLDRINVATRLDDDGDMLVTLDADDNFGYDVVVCIIVEEGRRLSFIAAAPGFTPEGNLFEVANNANKCNNFPTAVVRNDQIRMEYSFLIDEEVSDKYIMNDCLHQILSGIWTAYVNLAK